MPEKKEEINFFAKTNFRNKEQPFGIKTDDRRRHFYTLGKTGMGKTSMIQNMAIQDIRNGNGVAIVDPHGEFAEECLKAVPKERIKDVIYFNPADLDFPVALNIMEKVDPEYRHLVSSGLIGIFKKLWADSWGPRLEYILRNAILALLSHPSSTLLGINRLLVDKQYREEVLSYVDDPVVSSFWIDEFSKYNDRLLTEAISPIQNKVGQFLSSGLIRNIVGQTRSSFSVREIMDSNKILIMNLSKGHIGEDNSALLGAMMITKIQLAAMSRVDIPEEKRKDFYLYVDEFQNFATESFAGILSEARKYRLNLILAHQFMAQLDENVLNAVLGNVGTLVTFRVGAMDTEVLEKEFEPVFYANDLVNLDKYNIYLKLMIDGVATRPFSAKTLFPIDISDTVKNREKVIKSSRDRYAEKREIVEQRILEWSGMKQREVVNNIQNLAKETLNIDDHSNNKQSEDNNTKQSDHNNKKNKTINNQIVSETTPDINQDIFGIPGTDFNKGNISQNSVNQGGQEQASQNKDSKKENKSKQKKKPSNDNNQNKKQDISTTVSCSGCGKDTVINFVPDGVRPVFCKECLKEYRRAQAKLQQQNNQQNKNNNKNNNQTKKDVPNDNQINGGIKITKQSKKEKRGPKIDSEAVQALIQDALNKK